MVSNFFSRDELLEGLPARQASAILFAIESRTAHLMAQSRYAAARYVPPKTAAAREQVFLQALAQGRDLPYQPKIQDLERFAPEWAALVPDNPGVKAVLANMLARQYPFTSRQIPAMRQALSLDDPAVQQAYQRNYGQPLSKIYALRSPLGEQLRWLWAGLSQWLEELPSFWAAFSLTLTETVGAGVLALPIALAGIGPLAGMALLLLFGLFNILTIAGVVEAITRNGNMRYGYAFFGRLVGDYLGGIGSLLLTIALLLLIVLVLIAYYVGIATTLADATGIPKTVWAALLFVIGFYYLRRESLDATIASALLVGMVNIGLIIILSLLAWPYIRTTNLFYLNVPFLQGEPFNPTLLQLVFGVVLAAYFGHTSAGNMAKTMLHRDPTGKALLWGNVAAMTAAIGLYCLWVTAVNGAIDPVALANTSGTALIPLAGIVGPGVHLFGSLFVVLSMGMASIHFSLALFNQVREWLPDQPQRSALSSAAAGGGSRISALILGKRGRFGLGVLPVALIFLLIEWLLLTNRESFTGPFAVLGVVSVPVVAGIFPMLMLVAGRRKGDYVPGVVWRFLGHPIVVIGIYLIFLTSILVHGLFIWSEPLPRLATLAAGGVMLLVTLIIIRQGSFTPRTVIELRANQDAQKPAVFTLTTVGRPLQAEIRLTYKNDEHQRQATSGDIPDFKNLRAITFHLPPTPAKELKVWLHQITPENFSETLPGRVTVQQGQEQRMVEAAATAEPVILPLNGDAYRVEIALAQASIRDLLANL
jgi:amino acid permease